MATAEESTSSSMGRALLWGLGRDAGDGHERITVADHFRLTGGSEAVHTEMRRQADALLAEIARQGYAMDRLSREDVPHVRRIIDEHMTRLHSSL